MKLRALLVLPWAGALALCGCAQFEYRLAQPANFAQTIPKQGVTVPYPPVEYHLARQDDYLAVQIVNPTEELVNLVPNKSYVVDPGGGSHPLRGRVIAPHSHTVLVLPPAPLSVYGYGYGPYYGYYGPYWYPYYRWGPYYPYRFGFYYGWPYYAPYSYSYQVVTPDHWEWKVGEVRLRLGYESAGSNFEHDFVFERQQVK